MCCRGSKVDVMPVENIMGKKGQVSAKVLVERMSALSAVGAMQYLREQTVSEATLRSYRSARNKMEEILAVMGERVLTKDIFVRLVLAAEMEGMGRSTPDTWRAAVQFFQRTEGWAVGVDGEQWAEDLDLKHAMAGYRYMAKGRVKDAGVLDLATCNRICEWWGQDETTGAWPLMLRVQFALGARPSELAELRVSCRRETQEGLLVHLNKVKNPSKRMGRVDTDRAVLPGWERFIDLAVGEAIQRGAGPADYLFCPKTQKITQYAKGLKRAAEALGLPRDMAWTPHGARHGKASELLDENVRKAWLETGKQMQMSPAILKHYARSNQARMALRAPAAGKRSEE